jgi:hypothetical protein
MIEGDAEFLKQAKLLLWGDVPVSDIVKQHDHV